MSVFALLKPTCWSVPPFKETWRNRIPYTKSGRSHFMFDCIPKHRGRRAKLHICIPSPPCLIFLFSLIDVFKCYILIDFYTQNRILYSWLCCQIFDQNFKKNPTKIGKCEQKLILQWLHTWHENLVISGKLSVAYTELNCSYWWNSVVFLFLPFVLQQL